MKCVLPGRSIKAFGKAIFCLAKLGDDLYMEAQSDGLALKTVNGARSAYACFLFHRNFFLSYNSRGVVSGDGGSEPLKCKISNKSCVSVFRALSTLEKTVDHCRIRLDEEDDKLVFIFHCRHGIVKTHNLGYQETDTVQAVFDKDHCTNRLLLQAKILSEVVSNFPNTLDEVTMCVESAGLRLRNYVDEVEGDDSRVSLTEISLTPAEFDSYTVGADLSLTFCLKELRALIHFTDTFNHSLSMKFETAGKPIIISIEDEEEYQVDMVLATLLDDSTASQPFSQHTTATVPSPSSTSQVNTTAPSALTQPTGTAQRTGSAGTQRAGTQREGPTATQRVGPANTQRTRPISKGRQHEAADGSTVTNNHQDTGQTAGDKHDPPSRGSASHRSRAPPRKTPATSASTAFPSGSQFRQTKPNAPGTGPNAPGTRPNAPGTRPNDPGTRPNTKSGESMSITEAGHIPLPPQDFDFMETDAPSQPQGGVADRTSSHPGSLAGLGSGLEDEDVMDALFGEDNLDEVAEHGQMFGFGCEQRKQEVSPAKRKWLLEKDDGSEVQSTSMPAPTDDSMRQTSSPPGNSDWDRDFEDATEEDTPIESSFLPGTPPSKKFKPLSVLFGMDMFGGRANDSEILAPDSDSDDS